MFVYSVFDKKAMDFGPLFMSQNNETAKRFVFSAMVEGSLLLSSPSDFSLYCLGKFDTNNGDLSGFSPVELVCEVLSLMKVDKNSES